VRSVHVQAFPAIELIWHHADRIDISLARYRSPSTQVGSLLSQAGGVGEIDVEADDVELGLLRLHDAELRKRGAELSGRARVSEADLRAAVPFLDNVQPVASAGGQLILRGTASLLGLQATVDAVVAARDGALVVAPAVPFGGIATITLLDDPHVRVQAVGAVTVPGGFELHGQARVQ